MLDIYCKMAPAEPTSLFSKYWQFAAERQRIFFKRVKGEKAPWTEDDILRQYKFTNAYRASDRVSQFLIKDVIYRGIQTIDEVFFRIMLFKIFNRIDTWRLLEDAFGEIILKEYSPIRYSDILESALSRGRSIYSAAYIMPTGRGVRFKRKHEMHLHLISKMMDENLPERVASCKRMSQVFELLKSYPTIGDFLAYQYAIDINYSCITNFSEMEFVVAGPGSQNGIRKCFQTKGGLTDSELIKVVTENQEREMKEARVEFETLWGRRLQLIDCQNLFCEIDKYTRKSNPEVTLGTGRRRIKQRFSPSTLAISYWYPPKWGINERIESD